MNRVFPHTALAWLSGFAVVGGICAMAAEVPSIPPDELVRRTVWNELQAAKETAKYRFRDRKETPHGSQTKLMVETRDAMAGIVIAIDDRPLTAEEREAEDNHHHRDEHEVGYRDAEDRPVQVSTRWVEVHDRGEDLDRRCHRCLIERDQFSLGVTLVRHHLA